MWLSAFGHFQCRRLDVTVLPWSFLGFAFTRPVQKGYRHLLMLEIKLSWESAHFGKIVQLFHVRHQSHEPDRNRWQETIRLLPLSITTTTTLSMPFCYCSQCMQKSASLNNIGTRSIRKHLTNDYIYLDQAKDPEEQRQVQGCIAQNNAYFGHPEIEETLNGK